MPKKDKTIHLRLSPQLYSLAQASADKKAGGNLSSYIRQLLLSQDMRTNPELQKELQQLRYELNRIGVNINQIAKNQNSGYYTEKDKTQLLEKQEMIFTLFQTFITEIGRAK